MVKTAVTLTMFLVLAGDESVIIVVVDIINIGSFPQTGICSPE